MKLIGLYIFIMIICLGLAYFMCRFFLYGWRGFKKKDIIIFAEYKEFDTRVTGFWAQVWAVLVMIFVAAVSVVLLLALIWMLWQRQSTPYKILFLDRNCRKMTVSCKTKTTCHSAQFPLKGRG